MKKTINGYEVITGTAIAASIDVMVRQKALFIHQISDEFGNGDCIAYDYDMPEDEDDLKSIFEENLSTYGEDLGSFIPDIKEEMDGQKDCAHYYREYLEGKCEDLAEEYAEGYEEGLAESDYAKVTAEDIKEFWRVTDCLTYDTFLSELTEQELDKFAAAIAKRVNKDGEDEDDDI